MFVNLHLNAKEEVFAYVFLFVSQTSSGVGSFAHSFPMFAQEMEWSEQDKEHFFKNVQILAAKD